MPKTDKKDKILILGAYNNEMEIVKAAKELGFYTICTDSHIDWDEAPAKKISDEGLNISWTDYDSLKKYCLENNIKGVIAGFSEKRVLAANILSTLIEKPFYSNDAYLDKILDKLEFKKACSECSITVPKNYSIDDKIIYPVIIKPSDNGGSKGITICYNECELENAYKKAMLVSDNKKIIIEQYIYGDEVMIYFNVHNGIVTLSAMCDRIMHSFNKNITQLPVGYNFNSKYIDSFLKYSYNKFVNLIKYFNIKNGLIAFQSFAVNNDIIPFDPTFRLDGTMSYHIIEKNNHINILKSLIMYSMTGSMGDDKDIINKENPYFRMNSFELPILLGKGKIAKIVGIDNVRKINDVIFIDMKQQEGDCLEKECDFSQMLCRIHICTKSKERLKEIINYINSVLNVYDENNNSMIIYKFDPSVLD